jgi:replicative DNA helicase
MTRSLPHSLEAERAILGAVLLAPQLFAHVAELPPGDFYHPAHVALFEAMRALDIVGKPIDPVSLPVQMETDGSVGKLRGLGGEAYLSDLMSSVLVIDEAPLRHQMVIVRDRAKLRKLVAFGQQVAASSFAEGAEVGEVQAEAERQLLELGALSPQARGRRRLPALLSPVLQTIEHRSDRGSLVTGVPSQLPKLDELTAGFQSGELVIIAARPSMGKSSLATQIALHGGVPSLIFSLEMSAESLVERILSGEAEVDSRGLRSGKLSGPQWIRLTSACSRLHDDKRDVQIDDSSSLTIGQLRSEARRWRAKDTDPAKPAVVLVDYAQLLDSVGKHDNREREVSEISRGLKALAKDLRVPVIALSQLNRGVESRSDKRPGLADLRESGAIEQDADVVIFVYRDEVYNKQTDDKGIAELIVGKQRNGPLGTARVRWNAIYTRFEPLEDDQAELPMSPAAEHPNAPGTPSYGGYEDR